jgi:hypothetical protein
MNPAVQPALGMILKGYPRISETFISNEILLLEKLGFNIHLFSMRRGREKFTHESVHHIRAQVDYLPETLVAPLPRFLYHNIQLAAQKPRTYAQISHLQALISGRVPGSQIAGGQSSNPSACPFCTFTDIGGDVYQQTKRAAVQLYGSRQRYLHIQSPTIV